MRRFVTVLWLFRQFARQYDRKRRMVDTLGAKKMATLQLPGEKWDRREFPATPISVAVCRHVIVAHTIARILISSFR